MDYKIGDVIVYVSSAGDTRAVLVDEKEDDIKNGRPGFGGTTVGEGASVWGYDDQIVQVYRA